MNGIFEGRLTCDGNGNLLADEGRQIGTTIVPVFDAKGDPLYNNGVQITMEVPVFEYGPNHLQPVAAHDGSYVLLAPGEPSHNERHSTGVLEMTPTQDQDEEAPGYAGTPDSPVEGGEHHWGATEDDPHFEDGITDERGVITNTRAKLDPDAVAAKVTGHTDAYKGAK